MGVHVFTTPCDRTLSPHTTRVAQEIEIAAPHELQSGAHQANRAIAQIMCLPGRSRWHSPRTEQSLGDGAIALAGEAAVQGAQRKYESLAL
jgi:hypothetical protein